MSKFTLIFEILFLPTFYLLFSLISLFKVGVTCSIVDLHDTLANESSS